MRLLLSLLLVGAAASVSAQTTFRLVDPVLSVDGDRVATMGAPLVQEPFGILTLSVPGDGTYTVSERPFTGARRAGQFDGRGLYFAAAGRSVRLVSREPILSLAGPASAYVRYEPSRARGARGPARFTIADDVSGRGRRSVEPAPTPQRRVSGPRPTLDTRPAAAYVQTGEVTRLRGELDRLVADRQRLAQERDRLLVERDAARRESDRAATWTTRSAATERGIVLAAQERDRLAAEQDRLATERDQLSAALARTQGERDRLAGEFGALRQRAEDAEARAAQSSRAVSGRADLQAEVGRLRGELQQRDQALALLRAEQANRQDRMPAVEGALADAQRRLAEAVAERDRAYADRDRAYTQRDDALLARDAAASQADGLRAERDQLRAEADRLRTARVQPDARTGSLDAERAALARDRALLDADRASLASERAAFDALRAAQPQTADLGDRADLLDRLAAAQQEREALVAERDRLAMELQSMRRDRPVAPAPLARPEPQTVRTPSRASDGAVAFLRDFDFGRLANPDVIRRRLDEAEYPRWATVGRIEGDVLVLYEIDSTGRVVRTAVPSPIGGGLDGLAEEIVREMRFAPPASGTPATDLRSQVVVRFEL